MPSKLYTIWLNPTTYIVVDFQSLEGEILAFVVRLVRVVSDEHLDVARYDTAHAVRTATWYRFVGDCGKKVG